MTEDNFVDYVSLNVRSGSGGRGLFSFKKRKICRKEVQMEVMEEKAEILFLKETQTSGLYTLLSSKNISKLDMVEMEEEIKELARRERML